MFYFPAIEKIIEWLKEQGGKLYWSWVLTTGLIGAVALTVHWEFGFSEARILWGITVLWWVGFGLMVARYEGKKAKKQ